MKCQGCGKEIPEGSLYCENCGEDIHIVPDFEPEIELNIEQTINELVGELYQQEEVVKAKKSAERKRKTAVIWIVSGILAILLGVAGFLIYRHYCDNSVEYQVEQASRYVSKAEYEDAIACYKRALELKAGDLELQFGLAEVYFLENNKTEYEKILREIVARKDASAEVLERAYGKIIAIYRAKEDYQTINDLLLQCDNSMVQSAYRNYISKAPEFNIPEGYYTGIQQLKLSASGNGKIYYTMDGTEPTAESSQYTAPVILENGEYTVKARFINENGVLSTVVTKVYHVENDEIYAPELSLYSGDYYYPDSIVVLGDSEDVYYTTDGSEPTYSSNLYTGPIPLPIGRSNYKFAKIVDGVTGNIAERTFHLVLQTDVTTVDAVNVVLQYAIDSGKIFDINGSFDDSGNSYCYEYQYVTNVNNSGHFYIIAEFLRTADGILTKTGNNYAVGIYSKEIFKLHQDAGRMNLVELEIKTDSYEEE